MLDDLWALMDVPGLYYAGTSGLEFELQGQRSTVEAAESYREMIKELAHHLGLLASSSPAPTLKRRNSV